MAGLLDTIAEAYMRNVGNPARQLVGGGVRGLLGFDPPEYADSLGMEAYRNAAAMGNAPGINAPVGAFKAAARVAPELAMFIGAAAKTWDAASNAKAVQMEKAGKDAREIWRETGNLKGPDGKWRQEISDNAAVLNSKSSALNSGRLDRVLSHPEAFAAYPEAQRIRPNIKVGVDVGVDSGSYDTVKKVLKARGVDNTEALSTTLHELQHAVQQREGFATGGNPDLVRVEIDKAAAAHSNAWNRFFDKAEKRYGVDLFQDKQLAYETLQKDRPTWAKEYMDLLTKEQNLGIDAAQRYRRLAGEAEARATQARMNMTPAERRATFPYDSFDVPVDQLIVRGLLAP